MVSTGGPSNERSNRTPARDITIVAVVLFKVLYLTVGSGSKEEPFTSKARITHLIVAIFS